MSAPAAELSFVAKNKVYLCPGPYACAFSYQNVIVEPEDPQFVRGEIAMALAPFVIQQGGRMR
jgi:hypothetical protein